MSNTISYDELTAIFRQYRGVIIHSMVDTERFIDTIITEYFCGANKIKRNEFMHLLLSQQGFSLQTKVAILNYLSDNRYKLFLAKYPNAKTYLDDLLQVRNDFAHRPFDISDNIDPKKMTIDLNKIHFTQLTVKKGKLKKKETSVSKASMQRYVQQLSYVNEYLALILSDIVKRTERNKKRRKQSSAP